MSEPETTGSAWFKSSYSGSNGGECLEVFNGTPGAAPVRDSKVPDGPVVTFPADAWRKFVATL